MPWYDYECKTCSDKITVQHTFKEHDEFDKKCLKCGAELTQYWEKGTVIAQHRTSDNSKGGIFSKKFWNKNRWI
jgi:putative FmdB family regulatory protein